MVAWAEEAQQRRQVEQQRNRAVDAEKLARSNEDKAKESEADTQAFSDFLVDDMLAVARPEGVQGGLGVGVTVAQALESAEANLEKRFAGRPLAEATARDAIGKTWRNLAKDEQAERHLRRAVELREQELGPDSSAAPFLARHSLGGLCSLKWAAMPMAIALAHEEDSARSRTEPSSAPTTPRHAHARMSRPGRCVSGRRQTRLRPTALRTDISECEKVKLGPDRPNTLRSMNNLATAYQAVGKLDQALPLLEATLEKLKRGSF